MKKPNFFVVGAFKGGTTTIYHYLKQHPDIFMCTPKEPRYFAFDPDNPDHVKASVSSYPIRSETEYLDLFASVGRETAIGDASPIYLNSDIAARKISQFNPAAKIIISLRDPIARALSGYQMHVRNGMETRGIEEAMRPGERWIDGSVYFDKLERFFEYFAADQIKVVLLENMSRKMFSDIFEFLGVAADFEAEEYEVLNAGGMPKSQLVQRFLAGAKRGARKHSTLRKIIPDWVRRGYRAAQLKNSYRAQLSVPKEALLAQHYLQDALRVKELTGLDTDIWHLRERADRAD